VRPGYNLLVREFLLTALGRLFASSQDALPPLRFRSVIEGDTFELLDHAMQVQPENLGGGVFAHDSLLPCSLAWETFGKANGPRSFTEMRARIAKYRRIDPASREDVVIGCRVLTQPFFLDQNDWVPVP
jgi:putative restriction endonuclease